MEWTIIKLVFAFLDNHIKSKADTSFNLNNYINFGLSLPLLCYSMNQLKNIHGYFNSPKFCHWKFLYFHCICTHCFIYYSVLLCCFAKLFQAEIKLQFSQVSTNNHGRQRFADPVPMHFKLMESPTSVKFRLSPYKLSSPCLTHTTQVVKLTMRYSFWVIVNYLQNLTIIWIL